jgi:RNA polymerase sigma-70 factor (ECF subfamily)
MDDAKLVEQAQIGNINAIGQLYDQYQPHIYRFVWSRVRHSQTAEDLTGEIFTRMVTHLPTYQITEMPFRAWLYRIARNLIVDYFRGQNGRSTLPLDEAMEVTEEMTSPDSLVEQKLTVEYVEQALDKIDPEQRDVIALRFLIGLPLKEVALSLNKSLPAVKSLQHRGLAALRVALHTEASL